MGGRTLLNGADLTIDPAGGSAWSGATAPANPHCCVRSRVRLALDGGDMRLSSRARIATVRQEAPEGPLSPARHRAAGRSRTASAAGGNRDRRSAPPGGNPRPLGHHRCRLRSRPSGDDPRGPGVRRGGAGPAGGGVLRRLAHARRPGHRAVRQPRPAAAGRTDQPSRPGSDDVAGGLARAVSRRGAGGLARPRPAGSRGGSHRASGQGQDLAHPRRLRRVRPHPHRTRDAADAARPNGSRRERAHIQSFIDRFRYKASQGASGAGSDQGAGAPAADRDR